MAASLRSTCEENTNWAGRCRSSGISGAMGPSVRTPRIITPKAAIGRLTLSMTALASKPLCTMQLAHFS
jgi:hypothetical protein